MVSLGHKWCFSLKNQFMPQIRSSSIAGKSRDVLRFSSGNTSYDWIKLWPEYNILNISVKNVGSIRFKSEQFGICSYWSKWTRIHGQPRNGRSKNGLFHGPNRNRDAVVKCQPNCEPKKWQFLQANANSKSTKYSGMFRFTSGQFPVYSLGLRRTNGNSILVLLRKIIFIFKLNQIGSLNQALNAADLFSEFNQQGLQVVQQPDGRFVTIRDSDLKRQQPYYQFVNTG